jgi:hypothetical protein
MGLKIKLLKSFLIQPVGLINQTPTILYGGLDISSPKNIKTNLVQKCGFDESNPNDFQAGIDHLRSLALLKGKDRI